MPSATPFLFDAIPTWSNLQHLKLTNLSFPANATEGYHSLSSSLVACPARNLQTIYLGQITFLDPFEVACIACASDLEALQEIKVVDAYQGSIWGPRVRKTDVEKAATSGRFVDPTLEFELLHSEKDRLVRIRQLVKCEARTERIMGGDRVEAIGTM